MTKIPAKKRYITSYAFGWKTIDGVYYEPKTMVETIDFRNAEFRDNDATGVCGGCSGLKSVINFNKNVTTLELAFNDCKSMTDMVDLTGFTNVTNLTNCFSGEEKLENPKDLTSLTSLTNMNWTFANTVKLKSSPTLPANVLTMHGTFQHWSIYKNNVMTDMPAIPNQVTDMEKCFKYCCALTNITTIPNSVLTLGGCFFGCKNLITAPRIPANITQITSYEKDKESSTTEIANYGLFGECISLTGNIYIDSRKITDANYTFADCGTSSPNKTVHLYKYNEAKTETSSTYNAFINANYLNSDGTRGTEAIANNVYFEFNDADPSYNLVIDRDKYTVKNKDTGVEITTDTAESTNVIISEIKDNAMVDGKITLPNKSS